MSQLLSHRPVGSQILVARRARPPLPGKCLNTSPGLFSFSPHLSPPPPTPGPVPQTLPPGQPDPLDVLVLPHHGPPVLRWQLTYRRPDRPDMPRRAVLLGHHPLVLDRNL